MSLRIATRFARRELRGGLSGFRIFIACLALGVAAIAGVGSVRVRDRGRPRRSGSRPAGRRRRGEVHLPLRHIRRARLARLRRHGRLRGHGFPLHGGRGPRWSAERGLTQVKSVDAAYPLLGRSSLDPPMPLAEALAGPAICPAPSWPRSWPTVLASPPATRFRLGTQDFRLKRGPRPRARQRRRRLLPRPPHAWCAPRIWPIPAC